MQGIRHVAEYSYSLRRDGNKDKENHLEMK